MVPLAEAMEGADVFLGLSSKDADVTVHVWKKAKVTANHAFGKGGLNKDAITKVVASAEKSLN